MTMDADVLLVADDLTGAMDTAHGFAVRGHETIVSVRDDDGSGTLESSVLAVNTDTRYADEAAARRAVARVVSSARDDSTLVYKKVDSTLRGNVLAELEAALEASNADVAIVAPALPAAGRTTRGGVHLVDGTPVTETTYVDDEKGATSAHLLTLFSDSRYPVRHVPLADVTAGSDALVEVVRTVADEHSDADHLLLTVDATRERHLEAIADASARLDERVLYAGSGGLARYVRVPESEYVPDDGSGVEDEDEDVERDADSSARETDDRRRNRDPDREREQGTGALGIVGSVNDRTLAQLAAVPSESIVGLEPSLVVTAPAEAGRRGGMRAGDLLAADERTLVVITAARSRDTLEETLSVGRTHGYGPDEIRTRAKRALARAARTTVDTHRPAGVFVTGGDVAVAVCEALEATAIELAGDDVVNGVPLGRLRTGPIAGTPVVTKAGGFGDESTIVTSLHRLENSDER